MLPLLHGPYGEDGTLQGLLELASVPYVGSGVLASAVGMDKHYMKLVLAAHGLPVCRHALVEPGNGSRSEIAWPQRLPPSVGRSSSSLLEPVRAWASPRSRDRQAWTKPSSTRAATTPRSSSRRRSSAELECGVLQGRGVEAPDTSVVGEIRVDETHEFYDFDAKYLDEDHVALDVPADLDAEVADRVRSLSAQAFQALACEGLARVDFFLRPNGVVLVNELNTMPGFTPTSMFPMLWAATGLDYPALVDRLLTTALGRPTGLR